MLLCTRHHRLVHEGGFRIMKDYLDRWMFKRPDGRAVPACGYHSEDMQDDCVRDSAESYLIGVENYQPHSQSEPVDGRMLM